MRLPPATPLKLISGGVVALALLPLLGLFSTLGTQNWDELSDPGRGLPKLIANTLLLSGSVTLFSVLFGTWLAWAEHRATYWGQRFLSIFALLPLATPSYLLAATAAQSLSNGGWVGLQWGQFRGLSASILVLTVVTIPYVQLVVGAALSRQSAAEEEAARLLGASPFKIFRIQTLPGIMPAIAYSGAIVLLYAISDFGAVAVLDSPVLTWRLYQAAEGHNLARAALLGSALITMTLPAFVAARFLNASSQNHRTVANPRKVAKMPLGPLSKALTYLLLLVVIGLGVAIPLATLGAWLSQGLDAGRQVEIPFAHLKHTVGIALIGAMVTLFLAIGPAWLIARHRGRAHRLLEQGLYMTGALPGVLIAFGLMLAALGLARLSVDSRGIYATLLSSGTLLLLGYGIRFIPELYTPLKTTILQLDKRQEESAWVLGASPLKWFRKIALPALAPGASVAFLLGFLAVIKELPITLLLGGSTGLKTLAFRLWDRYAEALWHDAAAAGMLLMLLALIGVFLTLPWRRHA